MPRIRPNPSITIDDMRERPGMLVTPADLAGAGIVSNYPTLERWIARGGLPRPFRTPSGRQLRWRAGDVLAALGMLELSQEASREQSN